MFGSRKPPPDELPIPQEARSDEESRELIRAWAAHKGLHCSFRENTWGDNERAAWGILLTDVVRRIADAMHERIGADKAETIREIRRVFDERLEAPTAEASAAAKPMTEAPAAAEEAEEDEEA